MWRIPLSSLFFVVFWSFPACAAPEAGPVRGRDGSFQSCAIEESYPDQSRLTLAMNPSGLVNLGVTLPQAGFQSGASYDVAYGFDGQMAQKIRAYAIDKETLLLQIRDVEDFRQNYARAKTLNVGGGGKVVSFKLDSLRHAMDSLKACVAAQEDGEKENTMPSVKTIPEKLKKFLAEAGMASVEILALDDRPSNERAADYVWHKGKVTGGILTLCASGNETMDDLIGAHLAGLRKKCAGIFSADVGRETQVAYNVTQRSSTVTCVSKNRDVMPSVVAAILFVFDQKRILTIFTHETAPEYQFEVVAAREAFAHAVQKNASDIKLQ